MTDHSSTRPIGPGRSVDGWILRCLSPPHKTVASFQASTRTRRLACFAHAPRRASTARVHCTSPSQARRNSPSPSFRFLPFKPPGLFLSSFASLPFKLRVRFGCVRQGGAPHRRWKSTRWRRSTMATAFLRGWRRSCTHTCRRSTTSSAKACTKRWRTWNPSRCASVNDGSEVGCWSWPWTTRADSCGDET